MKENSYYVYAYLDPRYSESLAYEGIDFNFEMRPIYVGKGHGKRAFSHLKRPANIFFGHVLNKINSLGLEPKIVFIRENMNESEAYEYERFCIETIGRRDINTGPLTNINDGGSGLRNPSEEIREKLRNAAINQFADPEFKEAHRKRMSKLMIGNTRQKGMKGKDNPMYGVHRHGEDHPTFGKKFLGRGNATFIVTDSENVFYVHTGLLNRFGEEYNINHKVLRRLAKEYERTGIVTYPKWGPTNWTAIPGNYKLEIILDKLDNQQPSSIIEYYAEGSTTKTRVCTPKWEETGDIFFNKEKDMFQTTNADGTVKERDKQYWAHRETLKKMKI